MNPQPGFNLKKPLSSEVKHSENMRPDHDWFKYRYYRSEFNSDQWLENDYPYVL